MSDEQTQILEAILKELKAIRTELQLLRSELGVQTLSTFDEDIPEASPIRVGEPSNETGEKQELSVSDWLAAKGITVKNYRDPSAADRVFDQLAVFLGERFENLKAIHDAIRKSLCTRGILTLNLSSGRQEEIRDSTQFCTMLSSYAFLSSYKFNKLTKTIYATPQRLGNVINFFNGGWFERYVYLRILSLLSHNGLDFKCLLNPQISFPNGDDFELDLLFLINSRPLWVECKTGDYQNYIAKYSDARKLLGVPKPRSILVILDISEGLAEGLTTLYDITIANHQNFLSVLSNALGLANSHGDKLIAPSYSTATGIPGSLSTLLNKAGLRPVPEYRKQMVHELIAAVRTLQKPTSVIELKSLLAEKIRASKSQLQDLLNAIVRSGCFLDEDGQTVLSPYSPFSRLVSDDPSVIESKCVESYARAVLLVDATYFEHPANLAEFERVVGGKAPDSATIRHLRETLRE